MDRVVDLIVMGGGKMGEALLGGLIASGPITPAKIHLVEPFEPTRAALVERFRGVSVTAQVPDDLRTTGVVIAVKPQHVEEACRAVRTAVSGGRALSIAAGVPLVNLQAWLGGEVAVVRSMPNTPALVGMGASAIAGAATAGPDDIAWATAILEAVGTVQVVPEPLLDAVTGLSGSGPAYVFLFAEALIEAGVLNGLPRPIAQQLAVQTIRGAAELLGQPGAEAARLRADVTSPAGTTAAGLRALEAGGVRHAVLEAVTKATERSRQLGS